MKKILLILVAVVLSVATYSQVPLVDYKPVIVPSKTTRSSGNGNQPPFYSVNPQRPMQENFVTVAAYYYDSNTQDYKRTKIKINPVKDYFGELEIYVRGVLDNSSYSARWHSCNNRASKVSAEFDGNMLANNFEWKASGGQMIGTVYFNY